MTELIPAGANELMQAAGQAANQAAAAWTFEDYRSRKAANTLRRQAADLAAFRAFLAEVHIPAGDLAHDPTAWRGVTWGIVEAFKRWLLAGGYALATVNFRLSTVKVYTGLAALAGAIPAQENSLIQAVHGYSHKEFKRVDEDRDKSRRGAKKAEPVSITPDQARQLRDQPDTPQGRRDAVLMRILLDHGLRCGEVAGLRVEDFDLERGLMTFYRPKVQKRQNHRLSADDLAAIRAYLEQDHPMLTGPLLLASRKGGHLDGLGMSERAITKRVAALGERVGLAGLSAHDCRHYWATQAARHGTHIERLKDAGGWSSLAMPGRYIEAAKIANEGVILGD